MANIASKTTTAAEKFAMRFVSARKGVRGKTPIQGFEDHQSYPDRDSVQPADGETFMVSVKFVLQAKKVVFLNVHERVDNDEKQKEKQMGQKHQGNRHQHHQSRNADGAHKHSGARRPVSADQAIERAREILAAQTVKAVDLSNLREAFLNKRLQGDDTAGKLRGDISQTLSAIETLERDLLVPTKRIMEEPEWTRDTAEKVFRARQERDHLKRLQAALSGERIAAIGQRSKQLKAEPSNSALAAEIEALNSGFARRQEDLSAKTKANRELLADKHGKGLEDDLLQLVIGLMWLDDGIAAKEELLKAVGEVFALHARITESKKQLAGLVNHFEHRRHLAGK